MSIQSRALESRARVTGPTLLHGDLYPFNLLLTQDRVVVNDWPPAWIGAPFCDVVSLLSGARLSGIDPQPIAESHPLTRGLMPGQIDEFLALHSGFLLRAAASTGPDADPNIRGLWYVEDLGSTNGTLLNGRRIISAQLLKKRDKITIGHTVMTVLSA